MPDYNQGGFTQGSDGGIYGDPGNGGGSVSDYDTWDWKQIKAAVYGSAAASESDAAAHAKSVADPQSLQHAAEIFFLVQRTLEMVAQSLTDQAKALAEDGGPWKGAAADSFLDMMTTFSKQVRSNAQVLSGGATGTNSVPQQLANNAVSLATAQDLIVRIDQYYAAQAQRIGVGPMSNGLIPISQKPVLVKMMTDQMRQVLKSLAGGYEISIHGIQSPPGVNSPRGSNPGVGTIDPGTGAIDPGTTGVTDPGVGGMPGGVGSGGMGDPGIGGGAGGGTPVPYTGNLSTAPGGAPGLGGGGAGLPGLDPAALDAALNPGGPGMNPGSVSVQPFPGSTGVGVGTGGGVGGVPVLPGVGGLGSPVPFRGSTGTGGTGKLPTSSGVGSADPSTWGSPTPTAFPGTTSVGGAAAGLTGPGIGKGLSLSSPVAGFPGMTSTESAVPPLSVPGLSGGGSTGVPSSLAQTGTGAGGPMGMPMMPGMGGGAPGSAAGSGERSDASGLLGQSADPWTGDTSVGNGQVGSGLGAPAGGAGLNLPGMAVPGMAVPPMVGAGGPVGMPMMPGMAGGAPGSAAGNGERSDASGLLGQSADPWTGDAGLGGGEVGSGLGASAGGAGLDLPGMAIPPIAGAAPVPGRSGERSEASGLAAGERADRTADGRPLEEPRGTAAGAEPDGVSATGATVEDVRGGFGAPQDLPDDRVAVLRHPGPDTAEDTSAWDIGSGSFVPLLWPLRGDEEERDETIPGYASADEGTWGDTESLPTAPAEPGRTLSAGGNASVADSSGGSHLATWRPVHRSGAAAAGTAPSGADSWSLGCGDAPFDPDEDDQAAEARGTDEQDDAEEQADKGDKSMADLLVQDESVWGAPPRGTRGEG
jgi:hypothetical protein